jgi:heavy metal translocating P-type ATPase
VIQEEPKNIVQTEHVCYHCDLPVGDYPVKGNIAGKEHEFCCTGCYFVQRLTGEKGNASEANFMLISLGISIFLAFNIMIFSIAMYSDYFYDQSGSDAVKFKYILKGVLLLLTTPVVGLLGYPLARNAVNDLKNRLFNTDLLIVLGVIAAYTYSAIIVFSGSGHIYFDTTTMILIIVTIGRLLESNSKSKAASAVNAMYDFEIDQVTLIGPDGEKQVRPEQLKAGDRVKVVSGELIPVDGTIAEGDAYLDESTITGESVPRFKKQGDAVFSGSTVSDGSLVIKATAVGKDNILSRIIHLIRNARQEKAPIEKLANRVAGYVIPTVLVLAGGTFLFWWQHSGLDIGIMRGLSVILIACPCALGIATPLAVWIGYNEAARRGVLIKNGQIVENLARLKTVFMDKTGTITENRLQVEELVCSFTTNQETVLAAVAGLEQNSAHPLAKALVSYALTKADPFSFREVRTERGRGITGFAPELNTPVMVGNESYMHANQLSADEQIRQAAEKYRTHTLVFAGWTGEVRAVFVINDPLRDDYREVIAKIRSEYRIKILTGDTVAVGERIAAELSVDVAAGLLPDDKTRLVAESSTAERTAFIGDGLNDGPALARADVGIAVFRGTDLARENADVTLMRDDAALIEWLLRFSRKILRTVKQNLFWAFFYNVIGVTLAMAGILNPIFSALAMVLSSAFVIKTSFRLQKAAANIN